MTLQERLDQLIEQGAVIHLLFPNDPMMTQLLARARIKHGPSRLRWCAVFPEHQSHVHETLYDKASVVHDRDVSFSRDGVLVAYVTPYIEAQTDLDDLQEALGEWKAQLAVGANTEEFADFFENA